MISQRARYIDILLIRNVYSLFSALIASVLLAVIYIGFLQCPNLLRNEDTDLPSSQYKW